MPKSEDEIRREIKAHIAEARNVERYFIDKLYPAYGHPNGTGSTPWFRVR